MNPQIAAHKFIYYISKPIHTPKSFQYLQNIGLSLAAFWDYENVPLPREDPDLFIHAISNFLGQHDVRSAKVYARNATLPDNALALIQTIPQLKVHWVSGEEQNAVDSVLIRSAKDILQSHRGVTRVLLIAGDDDYRHLVRHFGNRFCGILLIYGRSNLAHKVLRAADQAFSRDYLVQHPENWWERPLVRPSSQVLDFCPKCGSKLDIRLGGKMTCRCGYVTSLFDGRF